MTVKGITLTTRAIIGSDQSSEGNTTTIYKGVDSLSINTGSVRGSEYQNFDPHEAWAFDFDTDVVLDTIDFAGLERGETMKITIVDASHAEGGTVMTAADAEALVIGKPVAAGTELRIEQIAGKARINSISVVKAENKRP